jgi:hypothetical protein
MTSAIARLTVEDYEEIRDTICVYCAIKAPDTRVGYKWVHAMTGTPNHFDCKAYRLRAEREGSE